MKRTICLLALGVFLIFSAGCSMGEPQHDQEAITETEESAEFDEAENHRSRAHDIIDKILKDYEGKQEEQTEETEETSASEDVTEENESDVNEAENDRNDEDEKSTASNETASQSNTSNNASNDNFSSNNDSGNSSKTSSSNGNSAQSKDTSKETNEKSNKNSDEKSNEKPKEEQKKEPKEPEKTVTVSIKTGDVKGTILSETEVPWNDGDTVLDVTQRIVQERGIQISVRGSGANAYVEGMDNLYEFDEGPLSGWHILVDGAMIDRSAGAYPVSEGQSIDWNYTVNYLEDSQ